ncbi:MAG: molybdopterin converting factor subunit 1 [Solibacillus sp.]
MITVLFFAQLQEEIGPSITYDTAKSTVQEVKQYVYDLYPQVAHIATMVAVNEQFATGEDVVKSGDVIAFLPPVSGG